MLLGKFNELWKAKWYIFGSGKIGKLTSIDYINISLLF